MLPHVEGLSGMFGMVSTIVAVPKKEHVDAIVQRRMGTRSLGFSSIAAQQEAALKPEQMIRRSDDQTITIN